MRRGLPLALCLFGFSAAEAETQTFPVIRSIEFSGNEVTQPRIMLREMSLREGDVADPQQIEQAAQAIRDLGLFRQVQASQLNTEDRVILIFTVDEKFYLLPLPRIDVKDSGEYAYGAQLSWSNLFGLNHSLRVFWEQRDRKERSVGREDNASLNYYAPQIADGPYSIALGAGYTRRPVEIFGQPQMTFQESFQSAQLQLIRSLTGRSANQGWSVNTGLSWREQKTSGAFAPPAYGNASSVLAGAAYRNIHFNRFHETGTRFGVQVAVATDGVASDYDDVFYSINARHLMRVGKREHQTLHFFAEAGARHGGPPFSTAFELGGTAALRGYETDFLEGDAYYLVSAEYLRPIYWNWLRALVQFEAGNVFASAHDASLDPIYSSLALGVRLRLDWFVNFDIDVGYAMPLGDSGEGGRLFAGRY